MTLTLVCTGVALLLTVLAAVMLFTGDLFGVLPLFAAIRFLNAPELVDQ